MGTAAPNASMIDTIIIAICCVILGAILLSVFIYMLCVKYRANARSRYSRRVDTAMRAAERKAAQVSAAKVAAQSKGLAWIETGETEDGSLESSRYTTSTRCVSFALRSSRVHYTPSDRISVPARANEESRTCDFESQSEGGLPAGAPSALKGGRAAAGATAGRGVRRIDSFRSKASVTWDDSIPHLPPCGRKQPSQLTMKSYDPSRTTNYPDESDEEEECEEAVMSPEEFARDKINTDSELPTPSAKQSIEVQTEPSEVDAECSATVTMHGLSSGLSAATSSKVEVAQDIDVQEQDANSMARCRLTRTWSSLSGGKSFRSAVKPDHLPRSEMRGNEPGGTESRGLRRSLSAFSGLNSGTPIINFIEELENGRQGGEATAQMRDRLAIDPDVPLSEVLASHARDDEFGLALHQYAIDQRNLQRALTLSQIEEGNTRMPLPMDTRAVALLQGDCTEGGATGSVNVPTESVELRTVIELSKLETGQSGPTESVQLRTALELSKLEMGPESGQLKTVIELSKTETRADDIDLQAIMERSKLEQTREEMELAAVVEESRRLKRAYSGRSAGDELGDVEFLRALEASRLEAEEEDAIAEQQQLLHAMAISSASKGNLSLPRLFVPSPAGSTLNSPKNWVSDEQASSSSCQGSRVSEHDTRNDKSPLTLEQL